MAVVEETKAHQGKGPLDAVVVRTSSAVMATMSPLVVALMVVASVLLGAGTPGPCCASPGPYSHLRVTQLFSPSLQKASDKNG